MLARICVHGSGVQNKRHVLFHDVASLNLGQNVTQVATGMIFDYMPFKDFNEVALALNLLTHKHPNTEWEIEFPMHTGKPQDPPL